MNSGNFRESVNFMNFGKSVNFVNFAAGRAAD
jgi:hypothetical protein